MAKPARMDSKTESLKIPPHSIEAEQSVLGGLMLDNNAWKKYVSIFLKMIFIGTTIGLFFVQ